MFVGMCVCVLSVCMCCISNSSLGYCFVFVCVSMCVEEGGEEMINEKETWREYIIVRILL